MTFFMIHFSGTVAHSWKFWSVSKSPLRCVHSSHCSAIETCPNEWQSQMQLDSTQSPRVGGPRKDNSSSNSTKSVKKVNIPTSNLYSCTISPLLPPPNEEIITLGLLPMLEKIKKAKPAKISFNIQLSPPKIIAKRGCRAKKNLKQTKL